jgi:hypothetical protein
MAITYTQSGKSSRFLIPTGDSLVDVTKMNWTLTPPSGRLNVPSMYLTEFQQNVGQLISAAIFYTKAIANVINGNDGPIAGTSDDKSIYQFKYFAEPTGFKYRIPFFSQKKTSKTNSFGFDNDQNPFSGLLSMSSMRSSYGGSAVLAPIFEGAKAGIGLLNTLLPGKINLENPQSWESSPEPEISVTWDLFNTGTWDQVVDNRNLAYILAYQNSPARRSAFIVDPPVIYSMYIPDVISMPACYVSNIEILNLGNTRQITFGDGIKRIVPEAYRFNMTFQSLLMDTRNIMNGLDEGDRISAISDSRTLVALTNAILEGNDEKIKQFLPKAAEEYGVSVEDLRNSLNLPGSQNNPSKADPFT